MVENGKIITIIEMLLLVKNQQNEHYFKIKTDTYNKVRNDKMEAIKKIIEYSV